MSDDNIEKLYKNYEILNDSADKSKNEKEFLEIIEAVKGTGNEKRLASQFIAKFFTHFPHLNEQAIDAHLDLCEDDDVAIRKQAIKDLPCLAKANTEHLPKIADVLAQLLQTEDTSEFTVVQNSLVTLLRTDAKGTLNGLFSQILSGEDVVRERAFKFLATKLKSEQLDKSTEDLLFTESKRVFQDVTGEEFQALVGILSSLKSVQTVTGQQRVVDMIAEQAELGQEFDAKEPDIVDRLIHCIRQVLAFFSNQVNSAPFVTHFCEQVLPVLNQVEKAKQLELLKLLAELSIHSGIISNALQCTEVIYGKLVELMPLPNPDEPEEGSIKLEFSQIECLLLTFHQLGRQCPELLVENAERHKEFKQRLQYLARGTQGYIRCLRNDLGGKSQDVLRLEENKLKAVALKTTSNINALVKDLFRTPPAYKTKLSLSWKPIAGQATKALSKVKTITAPVTKSKSDSSESIKAGQKRHTPITFVSSNDGNGIKYSKSDRGIYIPPSGKYSNKAGSYGYEDSYDGNNRGSRGDFRGYRGNRGRSNWQRRY